MSYANPTIPTLTSATGVDAVIESLRQSLMVLPWLVKSFGRAYDFPELHPNGNTVKVPKCYLGKGEYYNVLPNDFLTAQSFIQVIGPEEYVDYVPGSPNQFCTRDLAIVFWFNLKTINPGRDEVFTEELKAQVSQILMQHPSVQSISSYTDEKAEEVFKGYYDSGAGTLSTKDDDVSRPLMWPYAGFRFELTVNYRTRC